MSTPQAQKTEVWKWLAGLFGAVILSGGVTFFSTLAIVPKPLTSEELGKAIDLHFASSSRERGLYATEGQRRVEALETEVGALQGRMNLMEQAMVRFESFERQLDRNSEKLDRLLEKD